MPLSSGVGQEIGTYTPTLVGMVIGTGGSPANTATYTFIGGSQGLLTVEGFLQFGTSGQTFPATTSTFTLPPGFVFDDALSGSNPPVGNASCVDSDAGPNVFRGVLVYASTTTVRLILFATAVAHANYDAPSTIKPFTWASNDQIVWRIAIRAERV